MNEGIYVSLTFRPGFAVINVLRRFVRDFCAEFFDDPEGTSRIALTTHELLENAAKYSIDGTATIAVDVKGTAPERIITIRTSNRSSPAHIERLKELIQEMNSSPDVNAFYLDLMRRSLGTTESGLGLVRIRSEAEMSVNLSVDRDTVTLEASTRA